ncbi:MAG: hypothetical protein AAB840_00095 [Patescibacteria group bacterium]
MRGSKTKTLWENPEYREHMRLVHLGQKSWNKDLKGVMPSPWNKGIKGIHLSPKSEFKKGRKDEKHPEWKGELASYVAKHQWVTRWKGKPRKCEMCSTTKAKHYEWANISGKYLRDLDDYMRLCKSCHHKFDNISEKIWKKRKSK